MKTLATIITTIAILAGLGSSAARAESGETAVVESRAAVNALWGRGERSEAPAVTVHIATKTASDSSRSPAEGFHATSTWADNFRGGMVHEPGGSRN